MFAATSEERSHDGATQACGKNSSRPNSKVKKKTNSPIIPSISSGYQVTLPPLYPETPCLSAASVCKSLFSPTSICHSVPPDSSLSLVELPRLIAQVGQGKANRDAKWTEGPRLMALALGTEIPVRAANESPALR